MPSVDHTVLKTRWNRLGDDASAVEMVDWCLTVDGRRRNALELRKALCISVDEGCSSLVARFLRGGDTRGG